MKSICIVVPSEAYLSQAGARIRYQRITNYLMRHDFILEYRVASEINDFDFNNFDCFIISKCYDARSLVIAEIAQDNGKLVGVDLFDDYFSQTEDIRFKRLRLWLKQLSKLCDFAMTSTPNMKEAIIGYFYEKPILVMNDPVDAVWTENFAEICNRSEERLRESKKISILWYGIANNPNFPVGVEDLYAFRSSLQDFLDRGYSVDLTVLTNLSKLSIKQLGYLKHLPVPCKTVEWSEEQEVNYLRESDICFLPVNGQSFSKVKSLNRAVNAISLGCNVLTSGYDLYQPLDSLLYKSAAEYMRDMEKSLTKVSSNNLYLVQKVLNEFASPLAEAEKLVKFLSSCLSDKVEENINEPLHNRKGILFGKTFSQDTYKFVLKHGNISIGSPFSNKKLNFDLQFLFDKSGENIELVLSPQFRDKISLPEGVVLENGASVGKKGYLLVPATYWQGEKFKALSIPVTDLVNPALFAFYYSKIVEFCIDSAKTFLGITVTLIAEDNKSPWWINE